jgi:hypothetical protein
MLHADPPIAGRSGSRVLASADADDHDPEERMNLSIRYCAA